MNFWTKYHEQRQSTEWINKPSIFAQQAIKYFPTTGKLLDLAAGQGQDSLFFAEKNYAVTSTDQNQTALKISKEKSSKKSLLITTQLVDLNDNLPFKDSSFDIVYSHLGLHYFNQAKTKEIFNEIHRVLKSGGIFAALFNTIEDPEILTEEFKKIEDNYYLEIKNDLYKSYFSTNYCKTLIKGLFDPILLDNNGETYKDQIKTLIRFIGKAI